jgi:hypothetical protein
MTTTRKPASPIAVLELPRSVPALVTYAQAIATALTGNPSFPSPATIVAAIAALVTLLEQVLPYVQTVANADVETAATVIQSAGIAVRKVAVRKPRVSSRSRARSPARPSSSPRSPGQDDRRRPHAGRDRRLPVPASHRDRRGQLEPDGAARAGGFFLPSATRASEGCVPLSIRHISGLRVRVFRRCPRAEARGSRAKSVEM